MIRPRLQRLAWLLAFVPLAGADEPRQVPKDPQAAYEPRSAPGAGQEFLKKFVGDWDVRKTFFPASGEPIRAAGRCRQALIHGGRFLQSDFVFGSGPSQTTGQGLIGFDPQTGLFTSVWTDSRSTRMSLRQSREPFHGEQIVLFSRTLDPEPAHATPAAAGPSPASKTAAVGSSTASTPSTPTAANA